MFSKGAIDGFPYWWNTPEIKRQRVSFATWKHYNKNDELVKSGLVGPVKLLSSY